MELHSYGQTDRENAVITWRECNRHYKMNLLILEINMARPCNLIVHRAVEQHVGRGS